MSYDDEEDVSNEISDESGDQEPSEETEYVQDPAAGSDLNRSFDEASAEAESESESQ